LTDLDCHSGKLVVIVAVPGRVVSRGPFDDI
jgi:hypothetical protein